MEALGYRGAMQQPLLPVAARKSHNEELYDILEGRGAAGKIYTVCLYLLIGLNIASFMLSTETSMSAYQGTFNFIEGGTVIAFSCEYLVRICTLPVSSCFRRVLWAFTDFFAIIDLISILPFYVDLLIPGDAFFPTQWIRVVRLLRLLPPLPYSKIWAKSSKLLLASGFAGSTIWIICAALMYYFERHNSDMIYSPPGQQQGWNRFHSIPAAMYYSLLNFFGEFPLADKYSSGSRFVGGFIQVMGAAVMAIPAGALGNAFSEVVEDTYADEDGEEAEADQKMVPASAPADAIVAQRVKSDTMRALDGERGVWSVKLAEDAYADVADLARGVCATFVAGSVLHFIIGTLKTQPARLDELVAILAVVDFVGTCIFCVEYFFRLGKAREGGYASGSAYACSTIGLVDAACAIFPALYLVYPCSAFRIFKAFRILKLERYVGAFGTFKVILVKSGAVLGVTGGAAAVLWVIFSTLMYYCERNNPDPEMSSNYSSVGTAMWMTLLNLSGEAPLCEYTVPGKFISAIMGLIGVGFATIPMGVLGSGFQSMLEDDNDDELDESKEAEGNVAAQSEATTFRERTFKFLSGSAANQVDDLNPWEGRAVRFERLVFSAIFITILAAIMETVDGFAPDGSANRTILDIIEVLATLIFTLEYGLRYFTAPEDPYWQQKGYVTASAARFGHATSFSSLIDLLAIAPYYMALCGSSLADKYDGELRMLRIFRLLTLDKYIPSVSLIGRVVTKHASDFKLAAYAAVSLWLIFASLLWLTEGHDPTKVNDLTMAQRYSSMPSAMPYTLVHLTGDYPLTDYNFPAKCVLFFAILFAVGVVSVPTGLLASGFTKELEKQRVERRQRERAAHTKIETVIRGYIIRRRFLKAVKREQQRTQAMRSLGAEARETAPLALKVIDFLEQRTTAGRVYKKVMLALIILNVLAVIGESMQSVMDVIGHTYLDVFETVSVVIFTLEYAANVLTARCNKVYSYKRRNYTLSFFGIVDFITVAPFWVQVLLQFSGVPFDAFIFRIARLLRILQLEDFVESFTLLDDAWRKCRETMVAAGFMALLVWIIGGVLFYEFEKENPRMEGNFKDLPSSLYFTIIFLGGEWAVIDFTPCGQIVCVVYCVVGIGLYGIPVGAVFEAFSDVLGDEEEE